MKLDPQLNLKVSKPENKESAPKEDVLAKLDDFFKDMNKRLAYKLGIPEDDSDDDVKQEPAA